MLPFDHLARPSSGNHGYFSSLPYRSMYNSRFRNLWFGLVGLFVFSAAVYFLMLPKSHHSLPSQVALSPSPEYDWRFHGPPVPWFSHKNASESEKKELYGAHKTEWEKMGKDTVRYSVLTGFDKTAEISDSDKEAFYKSGMDDMKWVTDTLPRNGITLGGSNALDFGCGVGRLASALSKRFDHVTCLDQSQPHLDVAHEEAARQGVNNIEFVVSGFPLSIRDKGVTFSYINSIIVWQHASPPLQAQYFSDFCSLLSFRGVGFINVPTYIPGYVWDEDSAKKSIQDGGMQMHAIPQREVFRALSTAGCEVLSVTQHDRIGIMDSESTFFLFYNNSSRR